MDRYEVYQPCATRKFDTLAEAAAEAAAMWEAQGCTGEPIRVTSPDGDIIFTLRDHAREALDKLAPPVLLANTWMADRIAAYERDELTPEEEAFTERHVTEMKSNITRLCDMLSYAGFSSFASLSQMEFFGFKKSSDPRKPFDLLHPFAPDEASGDGKESVMVDHYTTLFVGPYTFDIDRGIVWRDCGGHEKQFQYAPATYEHAQFMVHG